MKIVIKQGKNSDDASTESMSIDGKHRCFVRPLYECPEDATLERDLISCSEISDFMKEAFDAGARGEKWEIEIVTMDYEE